MKTLKLIVACLMVGLGGLKAKADVFATNNLAATNNVLITGAFVLQSMTIFTTNDTPTLIRIYDGDTTKVTTAWTNYTSYTTNYVTTWLTSTGTTNTSTNTYIYTLATPNAAATNANDVRISAVVDKLTPYTFNPAQIPGAYLSTFNSKLTLSNDLAGVGAIIQYRTP